MRVNNESDKFHGKKFEAASIYEDISLAKGLEVSFLLGTFRQFGHFVQKAVDVALL